VNCALQVDGLLGLRGVEDFVATSAVPAGSPAYFGNQFQDSSGEAWQEIDLRLLSQTPQFLSISA
jgi:twitching motility protein PilI